MKIALLGYGKMGKAIEKIAIARGHDIVLKIDARTSDYDITKADVAIDFSVPSAAVSNLSKALNNNVPVISGTTGWLNDYDDVIRLCEERDGAFIYASNFSVGVNIFFELNAYLAKMVANLEDYNVSMKEIHHTQKLDAPSGTAITLAEGIIENSKYENWSLENDNDNSIHIEAERTADVPGTHSVVYNSKVDTLEIKHTAKNREGFALGAVIAAEWIIGRTGIFTMKDVLNIG